MPPGRPKKEKEPTKRDLEVLQLAEAIEKLEGRFAERTKLLEERIAKLETPVPTAATQPTVQTQTKVPVPFEWRQVVDEVLSPAFGLEVRYMDNAQFELTIHVPRKYSNATAREWESNGNDRRVKIMPNYLGTQGVREYCELVSKNLGQEILQRLQQDKVTHAQPA